LTSAPGALPFARAQRLTGATAFRSVTSARAVARGELFSVWVLANGTNVPRLGVVAPKASLRASVDRNRARRLVREAFRRGQRGWGPLDIVVRIQRLPEGLAATEAELARLVESATRRSSRKN
jgi:ribonuclease P protein component